MENAAQLLEPHPSPEAVLSPGSRMAERRLWILAQLDLEPIIVKAMDTEEGHGWALDFACRVSREYRRFLILCLENPDDPVVPSTLVDDFWHLHILDTQKYAEDCDRCFGEMLHHFPYFGMRGDDDAANLRKAWLKTLSLYQSTFGEAAPAKLWPHSNRCPNCGRRCNSVHGQGSESLFDERRPGLAGLQLDHLRADFPSVVST